MLINFILQHMYQLKLIKYFESMFYGEFSNIIHHFQST